MAVIERPGDDPLRETGDPLDGGEPVKDGGMSELQFKAFLQDEIRDSLDFIDANIGGRRERNWDYFNLDMTNTRWGLPATKGRSRVVDATLPSYIMLILPQLMDIMTSGKNMGEYTFSHPSDEAACEVATEFVNNVVLKKENRGEIIFRDWAWDGLNQVVGTVKIFFKNKTKTETKVFGDPQPLSDEQLAQVVFETATKPTLEITAYEMTDRGHIVEVTETIDKSHVCIEPIPPEEFIVNRDARNLEDAILQSHRSESTVGELIEMGYPEEQVKKLPAFDELMLETQRVTRGYLTQRSRHDSVDPMMRRVAVHEGKVMCDYDGEGVKWWYFVAGGNTDVIELLEVSEFEDQVHFADFCPYPIPHTFWGRCPGDDLAELQLIKTSLVRQYIDNLNLTNSPQREVEVNSLAKGGLDALLTIAPGQLIPVKKLGAVREVVTPMMAKEALTGLEYFDQEAEARTGTSKEGMGLNPEVLSNQSATAANLQHGQSILKVKEIASTWANGGVRKLFVAVLKVIKRFETYDSLAGKMGGQIRCSPEQWAALEEYDAVIHTGLGTGSKDKDYLALQQISAFQQAIYTDLGPNNGLVTAGQIRHTFGKMINAVGIMRDEDFITDVPLEWDLPMPEPGQDPQTQELQMKAQEAQAKLMLEAEKAKVMAQLEEAKATATIMVQRQVEQAKAEAAILKINREYELAVEKMEKEFALREEELEKEAALELIAIKTKHASGQGTIPDDGMMN